MSAQRQQQAVERFEHLQEDDDAATAGMYQPPSDAGIRAPLLEDGADEEAQPAQSQQRSGSGGSGGEAVVRASGGGPQLWAPLEYDAMPRWRWVDWCRYFFYR